MAMLSIALQEKAFALNWARRLIFVSTWLVMKRTLLVFAVLAVAVQGCHPNRSAFKKRSSEDIDVVLTRVAVGADIPSDHWIRSYDVYVSRVPWRNADSNYLPLQFIPRATKPSRPLGRDDYLEFTGAEADSIKPFLPTQSSIDSGLPFIIYLDYISADVTGKILEHPAIHRSERDRGLTNR
jgi:hypothetical protein